MDSEAQEDEVKMVCLEATIFQKGGLGVDVQKKSTHRKTKKKRGERSRAQRRTIAGNCSSMMRKSAAGVTCACKTNGEGINCDARVF